MSKKQYTPHLDFYYNNVESGVLPMMNAHMRIPHDILHIRPCDGLCRTVRDLGLDMEMFNLFEPTKEDNDWLTWEEHSKTYWGSGTKDPAFGKFTPLRQTIILFMAAMKGEL